MPATAPDNLIDVALSLKRKGHKLQEISEKLGKPITTVRNWVYSTNPDKSLTVNALANRVERIVLKQVQPPKIQQASSQVRDLLAKEALQQAKTLCKGRPASRKDLATTPAGQGRTALLKQLAEASASVFGWTDDKPMGMVLIEAPRHFDDAKPIVDVEATTGSVPAIEGQTEPTQ